MLLAGDFNSIINKLDSKGNVSLSKALERLVNGLGLHNIREVTKTTHGYTHYAPLSATRLDRIFATERLYSRKRGVKTVVTTFTDHFAVVLRLATDVLFQERGRSYWKLNISLLNEKSFCDTLKERWA
jgi:endonuclease/exonuclease/phosphatase family metal-dependent hydrolase